ncbi:YbaY family lipoprotein [Limoniibacter endophyticus]|uniref:Lipoprotein n=1 Tax=Limoniibacter endophyticus TaxID=1565040 RepID=A0A8J3DHN0_9HYPH|nr:YbaY family lipoprotein [Limoniibacter endophyticus]GHC68725.1 hypothetical protein GCM10010136_13740 [Limoniibacter endophyticus]
MIAKLLATALLCGVAFAALAEGKTLGGEVFFDENVTLPEGATASIQLIDVSEADAPAEIIAEQTIAPAQTLPLVYELSFDDNDLDERHSYALTARISQRGKLLYINDVRHVVDPKGGTKNLAIRVIRVEK